MPEYERRTFPLLTFFVMQLSTGVIISRESTYVACFGGWHLPNHETDVSVRNFSPTNYSITSSTV